MENAEVKQTVDRILSEYTKKSEIIPILQEIQKEYRYLPVDALCYVAEKLGVGEAKVFSIATFYENFSLEPKGKYVIKICDGTACHVRKSIPILEALRKKLGLTEKDVTPVGLHEIQGGDQCCIRLRPFRASEHAGWRLSLP